LPFEIWYKYFRDQGLIHIHAKTIDGKNWNPKTAGSTRSLQIPKILVPYLKRQLDSHDSGMVFPSLRSNKRWDVDRFGKFFKEQIQEKIELKTGHRWKAGDYRHTFASHNVQRGISFDQLAVVMGNSAKICKKYYGDLRAEMVNTEFMAQNELEPDNITAIIGRNNRVSRAI